MQSRLCMVVLVVLTVQSSGCAKKHALTVPTPSSEAQSQPVPAPSAPPSSPAPPPPTEVQDPLDGDLTFVNRYVREQGLFADVLFDYDRYELTDDARRQLEANARFLKERPQFRVALEGHADERGTVEYNVALGQKRAASTRSFLDMMGVPPDRLQATSYGEERPLCTQQDESCWQRNRRVHFEIVGRIE
jgi:peptidoglycan-associated lipoprotein